MYRKADAAFQDADAAAGREANEKRAAQKARDRAELAQVRGLLRPFQVGGGVLSIEEARALRDLRLLENDRLRVLFVEQALARPEEAMQLNHRGADVGHALVGLDRDIAAHLAERIIARLRNTDDSRIIDGCADLLPALWPRGHREADLALVKALAGRLAKEKDIAAVRELAGRLAALAPQLGEEEAAVAALALARRLVADTTARPQLSAAIVALAGRVGKAGAAEAAAPLARLIAESSRPFAFDLLCPPLGALLARLPEKEAARLGRPAAANVTNLMFPVAHFPPFSLAPHLASLAVSMEEKDAEAAAQAVARRLPAEKPSWKAAAATALLRLCGRLRKEKADSLLRPATLHLAKHLGVWSGPSADLFVKMASRLGKDEAATLVDLTVLALALGTGRSAAPSKLKALASLLGRVSKERAAALVGPVARTLFGQIDPKTHHAVYSQPCHNLEIIWGHVGAKDAIVLARGLVKLYESSKDRLFRDQLGILLVVVAQHGGEAGELVARCLVKALCEEKDWVYPGALPHQCKETMVGLRGKAASEAARLLTSEAARVLKAEPAFRGVGLREHAMLTVVGALASQLEEKEAASAAQVLVKLMPLKGWSSNQYHDVVMALTALTGRLPPGEAAAVVAPVARREAGNAVLLAVLAPRMGAAEAASAFRAIAARLPKASSAVELADLSEALAVLVGRLHGKGPAGVLARAGALLTERLAVEKDAVIVRVGTTRGRLAAALAAVAQRLSEGELIELLRGPLCRAEARSVLLAELGRRAGRRFGDTWELVQWVRANRPGLDLREASGAQE
jgi:hypothetical protein